MNVMWGLNLVAVKMGVDLVQPMTAAWLRQAMVLLICLPALRIVPGRMRELTGLGLLSGSLFYILVNWSLAVSDNVPALAIAGQLGAPFSLILAVLVLGERIHKYRLIGMALAFIGVALLVFDPAAINEELGIAITAGASAVWAVCSLIQRRLKGVPVLTIYAWIGLIGTVVPVSGGVAGRTAGCARHSRFADVVAQLDTFLRLGLHCLGARRNEFSAATPSRQHRCAADIGQPCHFGGRCGMVVRHEYHTGDDCGWHHRAGRRCHRYHPYRHAREHEGLA
jgi:uncharacterized membrane protein